MRIGVVGTGLMGKPIAHRLIECGYVIVVYNRTVDYLDCDGFKGDRQYSL
jgi:3-hydroxyisobutyrate dehydrogenase-like beta-hydroxyacid dehydrogenase